MSKLEVSLTVYNKGANRCGVCRHGKQCRLHLYEMHFCMVAGLLCVCLPRVARRSTAVRSVMLSLVGIAVWLNHVVWSCLAKVSKCS